MFRRDVNFWSQIEDLLMEVKLEADDEELSFIFLSFLYIFFLFSALEFFRRNHSLRFVGLKTDGSAGFVSVALIYKVEEHCSQGIGRIYGQFSLPSAAKVFRCLLILQSQHSYLFADMKELTHSRMLGMADCCITINKIEETVAFVSLELYALRSTFIAI
ncbi:hypothetical protein KSP40_PGU000009 [Platanthera guangdongensis]|uniref:Uncharacterized protein n=1 Tax=Platanthera guangdongensis TaxID=2320717 RepID=A0ABR2LUZ5_9ASPA